MNLIVGLLLLLLVFGCAAEDSKPAPVPNPTSLLASTPSPAPRPAPKIYDRYTSPLGGLVIGEITVESGKQAPCQETEIIATALREKMIEKGAVNAREGDSRVVNLKVQAKCYFTVDNKTRYLPELQLILRADEPYSFAAVVDDTHTSTFLYTGNIIEMAKEASFRAVTIMVTQFAAQQKQ